MKFSPQQIDALRYKVKRALSEKRYVHSLGVEKCAIRLSKYCLPGFEDELAVAALLHDITKEFSKVEQLSILAANNVSLTEYEIKSEQILHSYTAPFVISGEYAEYATRNILSSVRNHTVGDENMSIFDEIIFLADFIEDGREYRSSIAIREYVNEQMRENDTENNMLVLHNAALRSINFTILHLLEKNRHIIEKTVLTRNALLSKMLHI